MKLSEMQKYKELVSAHKRSEISNEELQKTFITDGAILSNLYQEMEMDSDSVDCHDDVNYTASSFTVIHFMRCYIAAAEMYNIFWEQNGIGSAGEILFSYRPGSATGPCT